MRKGTLSVQNPDGSWSPVAGVRHAELEAAGHGTPSPGRITRAGQALTSWLRRLAPERRLLLGLQRPEPAPYLPNNRARVRARKARRHMVQASRRANR